MHIKRTEKNSKEKIFKTYKNVPKKKSIKN